MFRTVYITTGSEKEAEQIAKTLVEEKLVACANIFLIKSVYWWEGEVQNDNEFAMFLKTKESLVEEVIRRVKELHSYEVPCIVSLPLEKGNPDYFKWIEESTKGL